MPDQYYQSTLTGQQLDEAFSKLGQVDSAVQQAEAAAAEAQGYVDSINPANFATAEQGAKADAAATAVAYTITVPSTGWTSGSLVWGGTTYTRQRTVTAAQATANPTTVLMEYAGGDYASYCTIQLLDTQDGSVVLWAAADPEANCQIKITEVRAGDDG